MKRLPSWRIALRWLFFTISLLVAIYLSQQIGTSSSALSERITEIVKKILEQLGIKGLKTRVIHEYCRNYAHVIVHLVLAFFGYRAFAASIPKFKPALVISLILFLGIAFFDEYIQQGVPGRAFETTDLLRNISGISIGTLLSILLTRIPTTEYS